MQYMTNKIGFIGLGVMGQNLVKNFADKGIEVVVYNRTKEVTESYLSEGVKGVSGAFSIEELIDSLQGPRIIMMMVSSGGVDSINTKLITQKLLQKGDIVVDLGNSNWRLTTSRQKIFEKEGFHFVGCGVSGGSEGALTGPSIMPGGDSYALNELLPLFEKVAAKDFSGRPCVTNVGTASSGHFVKMVHNGIEYAIMQVIAEIYGHLTDNNYTKSEIVDVIDDLNKTKLQSYLLEITSKILQTKKDGNYLINLIDPRAQGKGTGKWTVEAALDLAVPVPSIAASVFQRYISTKNDFIKTSDEIELVVTNDDTPVTTFDMTQALETIFRLIYLQGIELIAQADKEHDWGIDLREVVRIWQGGCIIRSRLLEDILDVFASDELFAGMKEAISLSQQAFTPLPAIRATLDYGLSLTSTLDEMAIIQAQRDYFGQHTYRIKGTQGDHTGGWTE